MIQSVRYRILILPILFFCIGTSVIGQQKSTSTLAYEYYNDQQWEKAGSLFFSLYEQNGVKAYLNSYIRCQIQLEDYETAEKTLNRIIRKKGDQSLYIDLAYLSELQGNQRKADELYLKPMKKFPQTLQEIKILGANYQYYLKYEYAQQVYDIGRELLNMPDAFRYELAGLHMLQRNYPAMVDEYLALLINQPRYLRSVQAQIGSNIQRDIDETLLQITKEKTLNYIQDYPGLDIFTEMMIWVHLQENNFDRAIDLASALDRRNKENGIRLLELARTADNANVFESAVRAYQEIIEKGPDAPLPPNRNTRNVVTRQSNFNIAKQEILTSKLSLLESEEDSEMQDYQILADEYNTTISELGLDRNTVSLLKELAYIFAYRLNDLLHAIEILDQGIETPGIPQALKSEMLLDKADIYLILDDPWEATFLYARVEKENSQNPVGSLAKFKKAMLAYYTGNFDWARMQLDVLKGSTSKLIANDAFEISLMIRENQDFTDSLYEGLTAISRADYLFFQKKTDSALAVLDSLIVQHPNNPIIDDALFRQAEIYRESDKQEECIRVLERIYTDFLYDIWGHKAVFILAQIYEERNEPEKAIEYYQQIMDEFPNSFYYLDSRTRLRELQGDDSKRIIEDS